MVSHYVNQTEQLNQANQLNQPDQLNEIRLNTHYYNHSASLKLTSYFVMASWTLLLLCILLFFFGFIQIDFNHKVLYVAFYVFLFISSVAIFLGLFHKCPNCDKRFLIEIPGIKHQNAKHLFHLDYWASTVIDVILNNKFTCMYCGTTFRLGIKNQKGQTPGANRK